MLNKKKLIPLAIGTSFLLLAATPAVSHECKLCEHLIEMMDNDGDGKISRTEFMRHHGEMFDKHDANDDRFLDAEEIHDHAEAMEKHMKGHGNDDGHHGGGHGHGGDDSHGHSGHHGHGDDDSHGHGGHHGHGGDDNHGHDGHHGHDKGEGDDDHGHGHNH